MKNLKKFDEVNEAKGDIVVKIAKKLKPRETVVSLVDGLGKKWRLAVIRDFTSTEFTEEITEGDFFLAYVCEGKYIDMAMGDTYLIKEPKSLKKMAIAGYIDEIFGTV